MSAAIVFQTALDQASGDPVGIATRWPIQSSTWYSAASWSPPSRAGWRLDRTGPPRAGILTFWLADSLYLVEVANGTFEAGSWFDAGWWIGLTLIAAAAWQVPPASRGTKGGRAPDRHAALVRRVGLALLIYGNFAPLNTLASRLPPQR